MESGNKISFSVPMAIVIAGLMIAGAVYFSNKPTTQVANVSDSQNQTFQSADFTLAPISENDYIRGNSNAKVVMIEYSDTECPYCKQYHLVAKNLIEKLGKDSTFAWVYRNFPISERHPKASREAEALLCAGKIGGQTGFWNYTDQIYSVTPANDGLDPLQLPIIAKNIGLDVAAFNTCLNSGEMTARVKAEHDEAVQNGAGGTPFSVLITNKKYNKEKVEKFLTESIVKYKFPAEFFVLSNDNTKVGVSGSMPEQFMIELISVLSQ